MSEPLQPMFAHKKDFGRGLSASRSVARETVHRIALCQAPLCWTMTNQGLSAWRRPTHCEEPPHFFDLRNFGPRVEANEGRNEQFAGDLIPAGHLVELCECRRSAQLELSRALAARDLDGAHQS